MPCETVADSAGLGWVLRVALTTGELGKEYEVLVSSVGWLRFGTACSKRSKFFESLKSSSDRLVDSTIGSSGTDEVAAAAAAAAAFAFAFFPFFAIVHAQ